MKNINLRLIYLYIFTTIGLIITIVGLIGGINLAIKTTVFKEADSYSSFYPTYPMGDQKLSMEEIQQQKAEFEANRVIDMERNRQRELANIIALITVGVPLYLYHQGKIPKK